MMLATIMLVRSRTRFLPIAIAAILTAGFVLAIRALVNFDRYRPQVISYLQEKLGKQVEIGRLTLKLFPLSIRVEDFGVKNPPIFPAGYITKIARVDAELDLRALLHRQVIIKSLVLDHPLIHLISDPDGPWNFGHPNARASQHTLPLGVIYKLQIKRAELMASNLLPSDAPGPVFFEAHDISADLEDVNLIGIISLASSSASDGQGMVRAGRLRFGTLDARNFSSKFELAPRKVFFNDIKALVYGGGVGGALSFDLSGRNPTFAANVRFSGINVAHLLSAFEHGRGKMNGKMEGELVLAGEIEHTPRPLTGIRGKGHITVRDGEVPTLQLNANLMKLVRFNNLGPAKEKPSSFNLISTDLELANLRILCKAIDIDGYGVDIDGFGSVKVDGSDELDYEGVAQITTKQGFFTNTFARFAGATLKDGKLSFPFRVGGTVGAPVFSKSPAHSH